MSCTFLFYVQVHESKLFSKTKWWSFCVWSGAEQQHKTPDLRTLVMMEMMMTDGCCVSSVKQHNILYSEICFLVWFIPESKACQLDWHDTSAPATHRSPANVVLQEERRTSRCQQLLATNWADVDLQTSNRRRLVCRGFGRRHGCVCRSEHCVGHCLSQKIEDEEQRG